MDACFSGPDIHDIRIPGYFVPDFLEPGMRQPIPEIQDMYVRALFSDDNGEILKTDSFVPSLLFSEEKHRIISPLQPQTLQPLNPHTKK